ncbi:uncharacterized protein LOC115595279 [Sparus aurata]|uniref:uncharacterized protein LOC115595279 n=1 Tax=Sparus aurata TaxID=8175 RepID=UPI0011C12C97|nr:uncharacterized protein LOC115595279 [Sparus aurata]
MVPGSWAFVSNKNVPAQAGSVDCGVFMLMYTLYMALDWTFDFTQHDMPHIRRWWCQLLLDNIEHQRKRKCADMDEQERKRRRMEPMSHGRVQEQATCIDQLPSCLLEMIFAEVVLHDGDRALMTLSLVCSCFRAVVGRDYFQRKVHFLWLDSVANWTRFSAAYRADFHRMYTLYTCRECRVTFKNCIPGYAGNGKRGVLQGIYSENSHPGFCSHFCQLCAGFSQ